MAGGNGNKIVKTKSLSTHSIDNLKSKPIRISNLRDARRLLGRLIYEFQKGTIVNQDAKDLCYLVISFCQVLKDCEFEERITNLENQIS